MLWIVFKMTWCGVFCARVVSGLNSNVSLLVEIEFEFYGETIVGFPLCEVLNHTLS